MSRGLAPASIERHAHLKRRNDVIGHLSSLDDMSQHIPTMIPMQILAEIDNARNPMQLTRDRLERAATENQFMNGKIQAIKVRAGCNRVLWGR